MIRYIMLFLLTALLSSCSLLSLRDELNEYKGVVSLSGTIQSDTDEKNSIAVVLFQQENDSWEIAEYSIHHQYRKFKFIAKPGKFFLAAFVDLNHDYQYQEDEPSFKSEVFDLKAYSAVNELELLFEDQVNLPAINLKDPEVQRNLNLMSRPVGEVVDLNTARFNQQSGQLGMWQPIKFLEEMKGGLYFLEEYSDDKIPVVFIHGLGGYPQEWQSIIEGLDKSKFQAWIFQYPSAIRLDGAADLLRRSLSDIYVKHKVKHLHIVGHSMGGLVARRYLNKIDKDSTNIFTRFISLSTPWSGHKSAQRGVDHSPVIMPCWRDMAPGSDFLNKLYKKPLLPALEHHLIFTYKGDSSLMGHENNDGSVSIASQLDNRVQSQAKRTYGFNESHTSVLKSAEVISLINQQLLR